MSENGGWQWHAGLRMSSDQLLCCANTNGLPAFYACIPSMCSLSSAIFAWPCDAVIARGASRFNAYSNNSPSLLSDLQSRVTAVASKLTQLLLPAPCTKTCLGLKGLWWSWYAPSQKELLNSAAVQDGNFVRGSWFQQHRKQWSLH